MMFSDCNHIPRWTRRARYLSCSYLGCFAVLFGVMCSIVLTSCTVRPAVRPRQQMSRPQGTPLDSSIQAQTPSPEALQEAYLRAVEATKYPQPQRIVHSLLAITPQTPRLVWNEYGQILMATWTKAKYFPYQADERFPLAVDTWLTAVPFVQEFCRAYSGPDLKLRLKQNIGLPPTADNDTFVEIWVSPQQFFRPCPDPAITDTACQVRVPLVDKGPTPGEHQPPWYCPEPLPSLDQAPPQLAGAFVSVDQNHLNWMCTNWRQSYLNASPDKNYPWTALGYTYDWGNPQRPVGQSEFVARAGTSVIFHRKLQTEQYCQGEMQ